MVNTCFVASASIEITNGEVTMTSSDFDDVVEIRVAIYSMGDVYASGILKYFDILDGYQWQVENKTYRFNLTTIDDKGIFKGKLNTKNYDVFTIDWAEADSLILRFSRYTIRNIIWKNKIADFIKDGGGYFGHCAGAEIMSSGFINKPDTLAEKQIDRASMHISQVKLCHHTCYPFNTEKIASSAGAYYWFSGWDANNESHHFGGCSLDVAINKSHPIFGDICGDTRRIRWGGGPVLVPPEQSNNVKVIAYYPSEEISDNVSTQVHAWKYTGRLLGFLKGFFRAKIGEGLFNRLYFTPFKATDWEMMDKIVQTYHANKPFMTVETYPNENQGRIILSGGHPEMFVWWGGHIEEVKDTSENSLFDGLHYWTDVTAVNYTYNWCIVRREAAWASKLVPDDSMPPIDE